MENLEPLDLLTRFGAALVIGLLVGLQREYAYVQEHPKRGTPELFAGVRTFALLGLLGCTTPLVAELTGTMLVLGVVLLVVGVLLTVAYFIQAREGAAGMTTEIAVLLVLLAGMLCYWNHLVLAAALGVATTVILAVKLQTRSFTRNLSREDVYATLKFAVISAIVLPVLPRTGYGPPPFDVLVPYKIWLMVVFISGISFLGYVLIKLVGPRRGVGLTGLLGGMASSTAVTLTFAQRSGDAPALARSFAVAILLAWTIMFFRVLVEVAVVNTALLRTLWLPMTAGAATALAYAAYLFFYAAAPRGPQEEQDNLKNPFELGPAITFGLLYALILLVANAAQMYLGSTGVYLSSIVSGVADVDAITLSMAELSRQNTLAHDTAARSIVLATVSNTLVKGGLVLGMGHRNLGKAILPGLVLVAAVTLGVGLLA
ncbi:MgtC/SapB family protein [Rhodocaloribacter litoris]|uniref:MgtC/SapB family protein n=1 Tax=Rhodocaloribacter litoris TaxID=2558931 RepID=UPI00141DC6FA|nr:MgtC/SapB family protein [Rhodocaloribacter litoris]QXD14079.1 MgtC/SapB family protein [Rhodocaloribacter litoris]